MPMGALALYNRKVIVALRPVRHPNAADGPAGPPHGGRRAGAVAGDRGGGVHPGGAGARSVRLGRFGSLQRLTRRGKVRPATMSTLTLPEGVQITADVSPEMAEILTPDALALVATLHRAFEPRRRELLEARVARAAAPRRRRAARLPARDEGDPRRPVVEGRARPGRPPGPPRRDHRAGRPQDDHQRAQLGREGVHGRLRGLEHAHLGEHDPGADQPARRGQRRRSRSPARTARRTRSASTVATLLVRPRGWHLLEKHVLVDGEPVSGGLFDFGALLLPQRARRCSPRARARTSTCPRWRATSRRGSGTTSS